MNLFAIRNTEGEFVVCPPLPFNEVVDATPAEVTVTITAEAGEDEECTREIYVNQSIERED